MFSSVRGESWLVLHPPLSPSRLKIQPSILNVPRKSFETRCGEILTLSSHTEKTQCKFKQSACVHANLFENSTQQNLIGTPIGDKEEERQIYYNYCEYLRLNLAIKRETNKKCSQQVNFNFHSESFQTIYLRKFISDIILGQFRLLLLLSIRSASSLSE